MDFSARIKEWGSRYFVWIIAGIFLLKLGLLFWSAHPFDFSAFVGVMERHSLYNWNIFEYWNKGNFLPILWYPFYASYLLILQTFHIAADQLLLLHFFLKFPFWIVDMLAMILVMALGFFFTQSENKAKLAGLLWAINPLIFGVYGIHGHYELLVSFSILLIFVALAWDFPVLFGFAFALAFSTKYFIIVIAPLFLFYFIYKKNYQFLIKAGLAAFFFTVVSYIQFFNQPLLVGQTIDSINTLSQAFVASPDSVVTIGRLNVFSVIHYFLGGGSITNTGTPGWFAVTHLSFVLIGIFSVCIYARQIYQLFIKKVRYTILNLFQDSFILSIGFVILLTNFQWHYMMWFMPFFVLLAVIDEMYASIFGGITLVGFLLFFRNEFGPRTFFLDLFDSINLFTTSSMSENIAHALAFALVVLLGSVIVYTVMKKKTVLRNKATSIWLVVVVSLFSWILVVGTFSQAIWHYVHQEKHQTTLAFRRPNTPRGLINGAYSSHFDQATGEIVFNTKSDSGALVIEGLAPYLADGDTTTFSAYVLFQRDQSLPAGGKIMLNDVCPGYIDAQKIVNNFALNDKSAYIGVPVSISCVRAVNKLSLDPSMYLLGQLLTPKLFIISNPSNNLYLPSHKLFVGIVGILGFLGIIVGGWVLAWLVTTLKQTYHHETLD